jgi:hypothetical protein
LTQLLAQQTDALTGSALFGPGKLLDDRCEGLMEELLKQSVYRMFEWQEGTFCFTVAQSIDPWQHFALDGAHAVVERGLNPQYLSLEGARLRDEHGAKPSEAGPQAPKAGQAPPPAAPQDIFSDLDLSSPADPAPRPAGVLSGPQSAAFPAVLSESTYDLRRELQSVLGDVTPVAQAAHEGYDNAEVGQLRATLAELREAVTRQDVLMLLLRYLSALFERAVLFSPLPEVFAGLNGFSHADSTADFVTRVRAMRLPKADNSVLQRAWQTRLTVRGTLPNTAENKLLLDSLSPPHKDKRLLRSHAREVVVAPLLADGCVAALLFADNPSGKGLGSLDCLEIFMQQAGLMLDYRDLEQRAAARGRGPS